MTYTDESKLLCQGDPGMGLWLEKSMVQHETVCPHRDSAWEAIFRMTCSFVFKGLQGSAFVFNDGSNYWNWETISSDKVVGQTRSAADGTFELVMEEFLYGAEMRSIYPTYEEAKAFM